MAKYFIENSNKINGITTYSKAIKAVIELGVGALNLMIMIPVILSVFAILASLYFSGIVFIISPVFLVAHIIDPRLPIYFGTDITAFKFIIVSLMVAFGLLIIKISNKFSSKICGWSFRYIIKSIKFKSIKLNDIVR